MAFPCSQRSHPADTHKLIIAADLLSIFVFIFSKLSLIHLISRLTPSRRATVFFSSFASFTALWGVAYILSVSFQCGAKVPMRAFGDRCVSEVRRCPSKYLCHLLTWNQAGLIYAHGTINILTDFQIAFVPIFIVWRVQIHRQQRMLVLGLFWSRLW